MRHIAILPALSALAISLASAHPAVAMAILQSTWEEAGGSDDDPQAGFARNMDLAAEDPFTSTVKIVIGGGVSHGSGVFIGKNEAGRDLVLTAAHVVDSDENEPSFTQEPEDVAVVSSTGEEYAVEAVLADPKFRLEGLSYDIAVVTLAENEGKPSLAETRTGKPLLFCSSYRPDGPVTIVGYGTLGTGTLGAQPDWGDPERAVAVHNIIDGVTVDPIAEADGASDEGGAEPQPLYNEGTGDMFVLDFDDEDGEVNSLSEEATSKDLREFGTTFESDPNPVDAFEGTMLSGDSGGPAFMKVGDRWVILGVVSHGTEDARYGATQNLADPFRGFINTYFPEIEGIDDEGAPCK